MEYAYATLLLNESGEEINEKNLTAVLEAAGCAVRESRTKALVAALEGVEVDDVAPADLENGSNDPSGGPDAVTSGDEDDAPAVDDGGVESLEEPSNDEFVAER